MKDGKVPDHPVLIFLDSLLVFPIVGPHPEVFHHPQFGKDLSSFRDHGDAQVDDVLGVHAVDPPAHELDGPLVGLVLEKPHDGLQGGALPRPVPSQDHRYGALLDI